MQLSKKYCKELLDMTDQGLQALIYRNLKKGFRYYDCTPEAYAILSSTELKQNLIFGFKVSLSCSNY